MSAAARASKKWIWIGAAGAIAGAGYLLYYGPGRRATFESKQTLTPAQILAAPDALDPNAFRAFKLSNISHHNHNTNVYTFDFDDPKAKYNGKTASCVVLRAMVDGKEVIRPYTPISRPNTIGHLDFVIKTYPNGLMSKHVHELKKGDKIEIKGPSMQFINQSVILLHVLTAFLVPKYPYEPNKFQNIALIAGGTGITPMVSGENHGIHFDHSDLHSFQVQMIEEVLYNPDDKTKVTLLYANTSLDDILLKKDLDKLAQKYPERLKVYYTVDKLADNKVTASWKGEVG